MPREPEETKEQPIKVNALFKPLTDFGEKEADWLIPGYIPRGVITLMAGDGGSGKTSTWVDIAASISTGRRCFFDQTPFEDGKPQKVIFLSTEDSVEIVLKKRLRAAGADMSNLYTASLQDERFKDVKFNSPLLKDMIEQIRPALVIFDPLQGFTPPGLCMQARNDMRHLLSPLIGVGEKTGTASLIIVHTNKKAGVYGRKRVADSADIWDIARSVLIVGETLDGTRYLSHEKSNYSEREKTVLFDIENGRTVFKATSELTDRDFVRQADFETRQAPQRMSAEEFILEFLSDGMKPTADLDEAAKARGISRSTLSRAKQDMKKAGLLKFMNKGYGKDKKWFIFLSAKKDE